MADKVTAHKVLVLESHEPNGTFISELFKKRGVDCRLISSPTLAISVLGHESFDAVALVL
jgi:DNA-binding response OmpR family regulator